VSNSPPPRFSLDPQTLFFAGSLGGPTSLPYFQVFSPSLSVSLCHSVFSLQALTDCRPLAFSPFNSCPFDSSSQQIMVFASPLPTIRWFFTNEEHHPLFSLPLIFNTRRKLLRRWLLASRSFFSALRPVNLYAPRTLTRWELLLLKVTPLVYQLTTLEAPS